MHIHADPCANVLVIYCTICVFAGYLPVPLVQLCHMEPKNPGGLLISAKLARRAAAEASWELRLCSLRLANLCAEAPEDYMGDVISNAQRPD